MITRRTFLKKSTKTSAGIISASLTASSWSKVYGSNERVRIGVIGFNGKGGQHIGVFHSLPNVEVVALCDADQAIIDREKLKFTERGEKVKTYQDMRKLYDQKDIDAVVIATPNHWHSLAAIWACQAGKDVYVEKPISHNIWEGRQLVKAARKYKRIVQSGTQNRSDIGIRAFKEYLDGGNLGKIKWAHGLWFKRRGSIGNVNGPKKISPSVDYNMWTGPADFEPLMRERLHYDWHWVWNTGNGDLANLGVHQIDDCRFICDLHGNPKKVTTFGERWGYQDDGETPNTIVALFEYDIPLIIEIRNLPMSKDVKAMDHVRGVRAGNIIMCEKGYFAGGRGGGWVYDLDGKKVKQFPGDGGGEHQANFIKAVRERNNKILHSPILEGHNSAVVCHMANVSYRLGKHTSAEQVKKTFENDNLSMQRVDNMIQHLKANEIDVQSSPMILGAELNFDSKKENFIGEMSYEANMLLSRNYREPFTIRV
jgi:predicted dehydrogenase